MDVVALAQHGFANAVATLGTACTAEHVQKLFRFTETVVFSFDGDAAGRRAAGRALEAALPHANDTRSVKFLFLPPEHDPDSFVREMGAEAFERCVEQSVPLSRQLQEVAGEDCDLGSAEGRARLLANAHPLWQALPAGLLKRQLLGELARKAQLPDQELMQMWQVDSSNADAEPSASRTDADSGSLSHPGVTPGERPPKREWQDWKGRGGAKDWKKRRRDGEDEDAPRTPRRQPQGPADNALRMLLLSSGLWEQLSNVDHQLLHELPGNHGELIAWLERFLVNHGPGPWSALEAALAEDGLLDKARQLTAGVHAEEEPSLSDLQQVLRRLWINRLEAEAKQLAAASPDNDGLRRYGELQKQIQALKAAGASS
jgi:DNA primase